MGNHHLEQEQKFDVPEEFELPPLPGAQSQVHHQRATYYDTDDALLQARAVTLRRRLGGSDDGWHLKLPDPEGRLEIQTDSGPTRPPHELTALVRGLRFDQPLRRQAVVETTREAYQLHDSQGALVAEIADDQVHAIEVSTGGSHRWREIEVELGSAGTKDTLVQLSGLLVAAGASPSRHGSKYARAMGEPAERPGLSGPAGLVDTYLQTQYRRITRGDLRLRRGENAVHKTRVAVRRTRSTLRVFGAMFDERRVSDLDRELAWYGEVLGQVRDLDIVRRHVQRDVTGDTGDLIAADAASTLLTTLDREREAAWEHVLRTLEGRRYGALLRSLHEWRRDAPWRVGSECDVEDFVRRAGKKADKRLERAASGGDAPDAAYHRARKAAKRARYSAELARHEMGKRGKRVAKAYEKRQEALGGLQDHVMIIETLRHVAAERRTTSEVGFACGVLSQRHQRAKVQARRL